MTSADVIFAGGGVSALVAALELVRGGRSVTIYEGEPRERLGGQCRDAFGGFFFAGSPEQRRIGIRDSVELAWEDWEAYAEFGDGIAAEQQRLWARRYIERCLPDVRGWMLDHGMRFLPVANWAERWANGRGNRVPRFHLLWGCGPALVDAMLRELAPFEGGALRIACEHRVGELIVEGGCAVGVRGTGPDGREFEDRAEHVVIAAGGYTGNLDRVRASWPRERWGEPPADMLCGVWPAMDGHMHDCAAGAGAAVVDPGNMWLYAAGVGHLDPDYPGHGLAMIPPKSGLWMRADGSRFDPPLIAGYDTGDAVARVCREPQGWSWMVLNRDILVREIAIQGARYNPAFRERRRLQVALELLRGNRALADDFLARSHDVVTAEDLPALAQRMSALAAAPIDAAALARDVEAYDAEISRGRRLYTDPQLVSLRQVRSFLGDRIRTAAFKPIARGGGPLVAIRLRPVARKTLGGILTDGSCRALREDGSVVGGLYAIGESTGFGGGGMNGRRVLEGTLLGGCVLTARELARGLRS